MSFSCLPSFRCFSSASNFLPKGGLNHASKAYGIIGTRSPKTVSAEEALKVVKSNDRIFIHGEAMTPHLLIDALVDRWKELRNVEICQFFTLGPAPYVDPAYSDSFRCTTFFVGDNLRDAVQSGRAEYMPIFLSEVRNLFSRPGYRLDVALMQVSPPDKRGFCSLGTSIDVAATALHHAKHAIAQVNPQVPRTHGDGLIHVSRFNFLVPFDSPLPVIPWGENVTPQARAIGDHIAKLVEDGACLQLGIGSVPQTAVLESLKSHKRLGIHTELFGEDVIGLVKSGVITGEEKTLLQYIISGSFVMGSKKVYDFVDDNPLACLFNIHFINNPQNIRQNSNVTAINGAIEVDLTGQVCADSIGGRIYSGVGGQMDFLRGAALSPGGKPIITLESVTSDGHSRIVPYLKRGAGVVTTRAHVHYVVTEHGIASLFGKTIEQRMKELIGIAHPRHREKLNKMVRDKYWLEPDLYTFN